MCMRLLTHPIKDGTTVVIFTFRPVRRDRLDNRRMYMLLPYTNSKPNYAPVRRYWSYCKTCTKVRSDFPKHTIVDLNTLFESAKSYIPARKRITPRQELLLLGNLTSYVLPNRRKRLNNTLTLVRYVRGTITILSAWCVCIQLYQCTG